MIEVASTPVNIENEVQTDGFAIVEGVLSRHQINDLLHALERIGDTGSARKRGGIFAVRNLLDESAEVRELAESDAVRALVEPILGAHFFPVRGILFDKIPDANWKVPWHQDMTIAVRERFEAEGFGPWSMKADVLHVQPPAAILEHMLTVRLHLDPCGEENGALRSPSWLAHPPARFPRTGLQFCERVCRRKSARSDSAERC